MSKKFPDLTGDGKVTKADILKGRKVFAEGGSLMMPVERQQYAIGSVVKGIITAAKKAKPTLDDSVKKGVEIDNRAIEKALSTRNIENKNALFFNKKELKEIKNEIDDEQAYASLLEDLMKIRETDDEIVKLAIDLRYGNKDINSFLLGDPSILPKLKKEYDEAFEEGLKLKENEAAKEVIERGKKTKYETRMPTEIKLRRKDLLDRERGVHRGGPFGQKREVIKRDDIPDGSGAFRQAWIRAWQNYKDEFTYKGNTYSTTKYTPEREAKALGGLTKGIASFAGAKLAKEAPAKTAARKTSLAAGDADSTVEMLEDALMQNPRFLDELPETDLQALMADLPPAYRSKLDPDMGSIAEDTLELIRGMDPSEVAKNLQLFDTFDQLKQYTTGLNPRETREFLNNVSPEDYDLFEEFEGLLQQLGPREMKAHGGAMGLLIPVEGIKPDGEMEEDYVSHVMDKTLSEKEVDYVNEALEKDDELSKIVDKLVLASSEFRGSGEVEGPGTGTSDEIPARLSDGEFVFTKKAVDVIGVEKLEKMMKDAEEQAERQNKALGGIVNDPTQDEKAMMPEQAGYPDLIEKQMLEANQMPSLMRR